MTLPAQTLDALLLQRGRAHPEQALYQFLDMAGEPADSLSVGQALAGATHLARALVQVTRPGDAVLLVAGPGAEHPLGLFACFLAGCTAVPLYPPVGERAAAAQEAVLAVAAASRARAWLATPEVARTLQPALAGRLGEQAPAWVDLSGTSAPDATAEGPLLPGARPDQPALLLFTSGSTGQPKGVPLTHAGLLANLRAIAEGLHCGPQEVVCSWMPQAHVAGLLLRLFPLCAGGLGVMLPTTAFLAQPLLWLRVLSRHRATITAAPDFAWGLCAQRLGQPLPAPFAAERAHWDFSALRLAISGGEMVRPATLQAVTEALGPQGLRPDAFHPYYGLTESLCSTIPQGQALVRLTLSRAGIAEHRVRAAAAGDADAITLVGNGRPVGDTEVLAVNPETGRPTGPDEIGEIWLRGRAITPGYVGQGLDPAAWQGRLHDQPADTAPFFRTGDLGFLREGQVFITGRLKELLIVRGKNHYPLDIEATVLQTTRPLGAQQAAAFSVLDDRGQEGLGLAIERDATADADALLRALRSAVSARHGLSVARLFLLGPGQLPRTPTQKIVRLACARLMAQPAWAAAEVRSQPGPAAGPQGDAGPHGVGAALRKLDGAALQGAVLGQLLASLSHCEGGSAAAAGLHRPLRELGLSSLAVASLATELRQWSGVEPSLAVFFDDTTLWDWAGQLATQIQSGPQAAPASPRTEPDIDRLLAALPATLPPARRTDTAPTVLLTGATGFLGTWLLARLLRQGTGRVICLVRGSDATQARTRLEAALAEGPGLPWPEELARVEVIPGDLSRPALGLEAAAFSALAERVDLVLHNAADVNFVAPYAALREVNVMALGQLWPLLTAGGRTRPLHFLSTLAVHNGARQGATRQIHPQTPRPPVETLYSGYAQSKWVAEAVLEAAAARGLPVTLHRPSLIVGDSVQGRSHLADVVCRFLVGCVQWGRWPEADITLDLVPVDEVAQGVAASVLDPDDAGGANPAVRHWCAQQPIRLDAIATLLTAATGQALQRQPLTQWLQGLRQGLPPGNALHPVHPFLLQAQGPQGLTLLETLDGLDVQVQGHAPRPGRGDTPLAHADTTAVVRAMLGWLLATGQFGTPA